VAESATAARAFLESIHYPQRRAHDRQQQQLCDAVPGFDRERFAAETGNVEAYARAKLVSKHLDLIAANRVGIDDGGFESDDNALTVYGHGFERHFAQAPKTQLAEALLDLITERLATTP
jgi:phosphopantothenoylcysteine synthetase/decarboxylase